MNVLVTGGAGYIGAVLTRELLQKKHTVKIFDKFYFGKDVFKDVNYGSRVEIVQGDIRDFDDNIFDGVDAVVHLAGLSNDPTAEFRRDINDQMNRIGTDNFARKCIEKGINRFTYSSSASIYDTGPDGEDVLQDENSKVFPTAAYSESKFQGEEILRKLAQEHKEFEPVILRQGTVYGQSPRMRYV